MPRARVTATSVPLTAVTASETHMHQPAMCPHNLPHAIGYIQSDILREGYRQPIYRIFNGGCSSCASDNIAANRLVQEYHLGFCLVETERAIGRGLHSAEVMAIIDFVRNVTGPFGDSRDAWATYGRVSEYDASGNIILNPPRGAADEPIRRCVGWRGRREAQRIEAERASMRRLSESERQTREVNRAQAACVALVATSAPPGTQRRVVVRPCECEEGDHCRFCRPGKSDSHGTPFLARKCDQNQRLVGIELEYNNSCNLQNWVNKWRGAVHSDGSCGWEAVTTPLGAPHIGPCMRDLVAELQGKTGADQNCGVHVHVDARDIRWPDMYRILNVYSLVEPILYLLAGQHRMEGTYCRPCGAGYAAALSSADPKEAIINLAVRDVSGKGRAKARARPHKKDGGRYKGINIVPWLVGRRVQAPDTTIEFRMHRNTLDASRVTGWAHLCADIVDWCAKATDADLDRLPRSALRALVTVIAPGSSAWVMKRVREWRHATTAQNMPVYTAAGGTIAPRRINIKGGVYACAV